MSSTRVAETLVDELVRGGIRDFVVAPGSRNGPLSFAMLAAEQAGRARLHVRIDERSAAFLALGLAAGSGSPAVVACTSGTAAANLHPAVVEAAMSGVPLVILTADRPAVLVGTGANQTIDQHGLFGRAVRLTARLSSTDEDGAVRSWADRLVAAAAGHGGVPGPVQLNVEFTEPLTPDPDDTPATDRRTQRHPWTTVTSSTTSQRLDVAPRTLVVVGAAAEPLVRSAVTSAMRRGLPCHVEASAAARAWPGSLRAGSWLIDDDGFVAANRPEEVLVVGRPTLGRALGRLLSHPSTNVSVVNTHPDWADPDFVARRVHLADELQIVGEVDDRWAAGWDRADRVATATVERHDAEHFGGGAVARAVLQHANRVLLGSSTSVRHADRHRPGRLPAAVWANRGAAGIDGLVSTAAGIALAGGPTVALLGDLAFLHDSNGLIRGPEEPDPDLTVVVVNNDGGGIFHLLEQGAGRYADRFERIFATPHGTDLSALCAAVHVGHVGVHTAEGLAAELGCETRGTRVIEVALDRQGDRAERARLSSAVAAALATAP
ncbi:MAG: 2-succinyl-5-enolpyruvyl-6-hydroxy-3-cyclohexene-1-carboxylic-acid synthase [Microthrixaceae bacterium]